MDWSKLIYASDVLSLQNVCGNWVKGTVVDACWVWRAGSVLWSELSPARGCLVCVQRTCRFNKMLSHISPSSFFVSPFDAYFHFSGLILMFCAFLVRSVIHSQCSIVLDPSSPVGCSWCFQASCARRRWLHAGSGVGPTCPSCVSVAVLLTELGWNIES